MKKLYFLNIIQALLWLMNTINVMAKEFKIWTSHFVIIWLEVYLINLAITSVDLRLKDINPIFLPFANKCLVYSRHILNKVIISFLNGRTMLLNDCVWLLIKIYHWITFFFNDTITWDVGWTPTKIKITLKTFNWMRLL